MRRDDPVEERLRALRWPDAAPDLRNRAIAAARPHLCPAVTWTDRLWFSRRWRLAAAGLVLALVLSDRVPAASGLPSDDRPGPVAAETARAADEVARQAGLPPDQADALARRALLAASRPVAQDIALDLGSGWSGTGVARYPSTQLR